MAPSSGVLPDPLVLRGPAASHQSRPSSNPCTHIGALPPRQGALGYLHLWSLDILKLLWRGSRMDPAETLPSVRCLSQTSNHLVNMHYCAHLPDWETETQKESGRLWGGGDLIALYCSAACDDRENWRTDTPQTYGHEAPCPQAPPSAWAPTRLSQNLTCDLGDAFQPRHRQQDDDTLVGAHPEQTLADQEAGDAHVLLACSERSQREQHAPWGLQWVLGAASN